MKLIRYLFIGIILFYLQVLVAPKLDILGITPFLLLPFIIFSGINLSLPQVASITFILGIAIDLLNPYMMGANTIVLLFLCFIVNNYQGMLTKDKPAPVLIVIIIINIMYLIPMLMIKFFVFGYNPLFMKLFFPELIYNIITTVIVLSVLVIIDHLRISIDI